MRNNYPVEDDDNDDLEEFQQQNSFEDGNEIFELRSQVNSLKIEREKLALEHQRALAAIQSRNHQLQNQNKILRKQKNDLRNMNKVLQEQCQDSKKNIENLRATLENITRKTAQFHKSSADDYSGYGDPRDMIKQLVEKQQTITKLKQEMSTLKGLGNSESNKEIDNEQYQKLTSDVKNLKTQIQQLKKKEISYKREYQNMLQAKQQIIKKMSSHNDESLRRLSQSKDKMIGEIRSQLEEKLHKNQSLKNQNKELKEKIYYAEQEVNKVKASYRKKEQQIAKNNEAQKEDLMKDLNEKMKKYLQDKQSKLKKADNRVYELQNQILVLKQEIGKLKADTTALQQLNNYLETSNSQYESIKKKLQQQVYKKQKQIGELRQKYFEEVSDLKKEVITQRATFDQKIMGLQEQLTQKKYITARYEEQFNKRDRINADTTKKQYETFQAQISKLTKDKSQLNEQIAALTEKYKEKSQRLLNLERNLKKDYEQKIENLQIQLIKAKRKSTDKGEDNYKKQQAENQIRKLKMVNQHYQLDKEDKIREISKLRQKNMSLQQSMRQAENRSTDFQAKYKNKKEDYETLQKQFDELGQKYKRGVHDLQEQIEQMTHQIDKLKRSSQRKKQQSQQLQSNLTNQLKQYKNKVRQLSSQLDDIKTNKVENSKLTDMKISKYIQQIAVLKQEKQLAIKAQGKNNREIESLYQDQKAKLMQYIQQLEQSNEIMKDKVDLLQKKNKKNNLNLEEEMKQLKIEYSQSLTQINLLLQKYKKLEDIHIKCLADYDSLKEQYEDLHSNFVESFKEKNKILEELNSAYDQVNKLNNVLMSKEEQLSRTRIVNCPHLDENPQNQGYQVQRSRDRDIQHQIHRDMNRINRNTVHQSPTTSFRNQLGVQQFNQATNYRRRQNTSYYPCNHRQTLN